MNTVSLAMIVRNESKVLARCLDSVKDFVDEIIVVDTGSTDDTKAIAKTYTDKIYDFEWIDDFSAARNFAFSQATSDWVMWLDADDILFGSENLRPVISSLPDNVKCLYWKYIVGKDRYGNTTLEYLRERCVRRDAGFQWNGTIHEALTNRTPFDSLTVDGIYNEHVPDTGISLIKNDRNLSILKKKKSKNTRDLFYLGNEYMDHGNYAKAIETYRQYLEVATWADEMFLACIRMSESYQQLNQLDKAIDAAFAAIKINPTWPHGYFTLAKLYYFKQDWLKVTHWSVIGQQMKVPATAVFMNPMDWCYNWIIYYVNALYQTKQVEAAFNWTQKALSVFPDDAMHLYNYSFFKDVLQLNSEN